MSQTARTRAVGARDLFPVRPLLTHASAGDPQSLKNSSDSVQGQSLSIGAPEDTLEQPEPNPAKEPVIPESDTDEEKKEGEEGE